MLGDHYRQGESAVTLRSRDRGATVYRGKPAMYGRASDHSDGKGSGTVNSVKLIVLTLVLVVALDGVGVAHRERVHLQAIAGLAALMGTEQPATVGWKDTGERPCEATFAVAETNGVDVQSYEVYDLDYLVILTQPVKIAGFSMNVSA